jgi:tRNA threonylcarbamoyladenosine biosynthesis protein TsaB
MTAPFVAEMLAERGLRVSDCDAVCLSMGPGSYTGLRVGSSTAKGLCFGGGIPLLAVGTLDVLAAQAIAAGLPAGCTHIVPMIDARRMEVYTAVYSASGERLTDVSPKIVDDTFGQWLAGESIAPKNCATLGNIRGRVPFREGSRSDVFWGNTLSGGILFIGDGVSKCEQVLAGEGRWFRQECPTAEAMLQPALEEFQASRFRDTAYFEPFYLKDFVATVGKKLF